VVEDMAALQNAIMQRLAACHDLHLHDGIQVLDTLTE